MSGRVRDSASTWFGRVALHALLALAVLAAVASVASSAGSGGASATQTSLNLPTAAASIPASQGGGSYIADARNNVVYKVDAAGHITTVAGTGTGGETGDGGPAVNAELNGPTDAVPTPDGGILIADAGALLSGVNTGAGTVRKVSPSGTITTVAGGPASTNCGQPMTGVNWEQNGCPATNAYLGTPTSAVPLSGGGFLIADWADNDVRKVDSNGTITRVAGEGPNNYHGDCVEPCAAVDHTLAGPTSAIPYNAGGAAVATPGSGFLIAEEQGCHIDYVDSAGHMSTLAGTSTCRGSGDPEAPDAATSATSVPLSLPTDARPTADGGFLLADAADCKVRKYDAVNKTLTTVATDSACKANFGGTNGGFGTTAAIPSPSSGFLVADSSASRVVEPNGSGGVTTFAGTGTVGYNAELPVISGTRSVGSTLHCSTGRWSNSPTGFTYQWKRNGAAITGAHAAAYKVVAADNHHSLTCVVTEVGGSGGNSSATSAAAPIGASIPPPAISQLKVSPKKFKTHKTKKRKAGAKISFKLTTAATVRFTVNRAKSGRKRVVGGKTTCVAQTKLNRTAPKCTRLVKFGSFTATGKPGSNTVKMPLTLGGHKLKPGSYTLVAVPSSGGRTGSPASATFKVAK